MINGLNGKFHVIRIITHTQWPCDLSFNSPCSSTSPPPQVSSHRLLPAHRPSTHRPLPLFGQLPFRALEGPQSQTWLSLDCAPAVILLQRSSLGGSLSFPVLYPSDPSNPRAVIHMPCFACGLLNPHATLLSSHRTQEEFGI